MTHRRILLHWVLVPSRAPSPFCLQDKGESQPSFSDQEASMSHVSQDPGTGLSVGRGDSISEDWCLLLIISHASKSVHIPYPTCLSDYPIR